MALAFDAGSSGTRDASGALVIAHTCTGANLILIVCVTQQGSGNTPTVTYNGVAMTGLTSRAYTNGQNDVFYLLNPATGTNNISIDTGSDQKSGAAASYTGNGGGPDANTGAANSVATTSLSASLASVADNCWHILGASTQVSGQTASTGATQRAVGAQANCTAGIYDSNSAKTPAGSVSEDVTFSSARFGWTMLTIKPLHTQTITDAITSAEVLKQGNKLSDSITMITIYLNAITDAMGITEIIGRIKVGFQNLTKNSASMTNQSKNASTATNQSKNASTFTNQEKI